MKASLCVIRNVLCVNTYLEKHIKAVSLFLQMNYDRLFSEQVANIRSSVIRELLEISQQPGIISFAGGLPNPEAFPIEDIREIVNKVLDTESTTALQYGSTPGLPELRDEIAKYVHARGIHTKADNIRTMVGSQQALDAIGRIFLNKNDVVFVALPTYLGAINVFYYYGAQMMGIPLDNDGMKVDVLEESIKKLKAQGKKLKLIYTVPTFQNPAGVELSESRRKHMADLAEEYDLIIVEDEPYHELRFEGKSLKPIFAHDTNERVLYLETFSKVLAPGLRLGYIIGPLDLVKRIGMAKQTMDLCTPPFTQLIAMHYLKDGYMKNHIPKIVDMYRRKRNIMLKSMEEYFPKGCTWTRPRGGMFLWATIPESVNTVDMFQDAIAEKVAYVHGHAFHVDGKGQSSMRLNYTNPSDENVAEGIRRLGKVIKKHL